MAVRDTSDRRWGFEYSRVRIAGKPYLDRYIAYVYKCRLRLHKFFRGDDDRAPHDHRWWFITFPFASYTERYWVKEMRWGTMLPGTYAAWRAKERVVKAWRFHFRPAEFRHIVLGRADGSTKPFWTFVITGSAERKWGFWPTPTKFVRQEDWK